MSATIAGVLHIYVAFDWGDEIVLDKAAALVPASRHELSRRRRTPSSFSYRPAPLHLALDATPLDLPEIGPLQAAAEVTLFDFAAVSLDLCVSFNLERERLTRLAGALADPA